MTYLKKYGYLNLKTNETDSSLGDSTAPQTMIHIQNQSEFEEQAEQIRNSIRYLLYCQRKHSIYCKLLIKEYFRNFQRLHKLNVTGLIDKTTMEKMKSPRCGVPDIVSNQDKKRRRYKRGFPQL